MEYCDGAKIFDEAITQDELAQNLFKMHALNLVHLDIKPANIAFSPQFDRWVFLDFGYTQFIKEDF